MSARYNPRTGHDPGRRLRPTHPPSRPPQRTGRLGGMPDAFPGTGRGSKWRGAGKAAGAAGAAVGAAIMMYEYYEGLNNPKPSNGYPPWFTVSNGRLHYWDGVSVQTNPANLAESLGCRPWRMTSRLDRVRSYWMRFFAPGALCTPYGESREGKAIFDLPPGPALVNLPGVRPNPPPPFPRPSPYSDPAFWPPLNPDGSPRPRRRPRVRPRRDPRPQNLPEVGVIGRPGREPAVVSRPRPVRPPRGTKETKAHGKMGAIATTVFWLYEIASDARDWRDIILDAKRAGDGRPIPRGDEAKWAAMLDPDTYVNLDPRALIRGAVEYYLEEKLGAKLGDVNTQLAAAFDTPVSSKFTLLSDGGRISLDSEVGGSAISEALDFLEEQWNSFNEERND